MSFLSNFTANLPFFKKKEAPQAYFALCIGMEKLTAALWSVEDDKLIIVDTADDFYSNEDDIIKTTDRLLDAVVGEREIDPHKILFGVPDAWLLDENLKEDYIKLLRKLVKELEVTPMAYVSQTNALVNFLEKREGVPETAILVGLENKHLAVTVVRAGKPDGTKIIERSEDLGVDIEKVLLTFTSVEVLPSKILLYGSDDLDKVKAKLLSFSWMSKLSFLHFPKIEVLPGNAEIAGICFAGACEINPKVIYHHTEDKRKGTVDTDTIAAQKLEEKETGQEKEEKKHDSDEKNKNLHDDKEQNQDLGFIVGDVATQEKKEKEKISQDTALGISEDYFLETETLEEPYQAVRRAQDRREVLVSPHGRFRVPGLPILGFFKKFVPKKESKLLAILMVFGLIFFTLLASYIFLLKADVKIYVEPKILENDTQVIADPAVKTVNEADKTIPGQIVETDVSGSGTGSATGKKQVGDLAKGTVKIINNSDQSQDFSKGVIVTSSGGLKFTLDLSVNIASTSAISESKSTKTVTVTAVEIGADSNLATGTQFAIAGRSGSQVAVVSEGNFSGGTSKNVTVVSDSDQQKLLAQVASDLRKSAQQKLQEKLPDKKIIEEALAENITKKTFSKGVGDQATDFKLNLTAHYKGTAFDDKDLRMIVSKLVSTNVPSGFSLDLADTETQADVSKVEKDGRVIFLARFKAKMIPNLNIDDIKKAIKGKSQTSAIDTIKAMDNVLGAKIKLTPALPGPFKFLPILGKNIQLEVGFK